MTSQVQLAGVAPLARQRHTVAGVNTSLTKKEEASASSRKLYENNIL